MFKSFIDKYCLGKLFLERGHSLEPLPPHNITGWTFALLLKIILFKSSIIAITKVYIKLVDKSLYLTDSTL